MKVVRLGVRVYIDLTSELAIGSLTITESKPRVARQMPIEAEQGQIER